MKKLFFVTAFAASILSAMDNDTYFALEKASLELTLEGMKRQKICLESGECTTSELIRINEETQEKIHNLYLQNRTTPSKTALYYTAHSAELDRLYSDGDMAEQLHRIEEEIKKVDEEIKALREVEK